jgi:hypothetical protein
VKTKNNVWFLLPKQLKEDIGKIQFQSPKHKDKALKFIRYILKKNTEDNFDSLKYRNIPSSYFKKVYKGDYKKEFLDLLVGNNIIEVNNYYSTTNHTTKSYRIHGSYMSCDIQYSSTSFSDSSYISDSTIVLTDYPIYSSVPIMLPDFKRLPLKHSEVNFSLTKKMHDLGLSAYPFLKMHPSLPKSISKPVRYNKRLEKETIADMFDSLMIDYKKILENNDEVVNKISYNSFKIGSEVDGTYFEVYNRIFGTTQWMTKVGAIITAQKIGATLIQDKNNYYIDELDRYVETKKRNMLISYNTTITALKKRIYSINRNPTNYRLDTIFTSMCSHTLDIIKQDNNLIEIDLVNSQYAIFANWLMEQDCYNQNDVKLFCSLAIEGKLYEYIHHELKLEDRKQAKKIMMVVAFSSPKFNSNQKTQFKELFPNVYQFIADYNKQNDGRFAVCLQNKESKIFIDGLMNILIRKGYFVLTKHDSLIIREKDRVEIQQLVKDYFDVINFKATIKCGEETSHNGVLDTQIPDQTDKEYKCQAIESKQKNELREQQNEDNLIKPLPYWFLTHKKYINGWGRRTGEEKWTAQLDRLRQMGYDLEQYDIYVKANV